MADDNSDQQPTFWHGLMAGLQSGINQAPSNPLVNIGLGLMSAAKPGGNVGDALMQANQQTLQNRAAQQAYGIQNYQLQRQQAMMPAYQDVLTALARRMASQQTNNALPPAGISQGAAPTADAPTTAIQTAAQAPQQTAQPPQIPNRYRPLPPITLGGNPQGDVQMGQAMAVLGIPGASSFTDSPKNLQASQDYLNKQRQYQVAPALSVLDSVATAGNADDLVKNDPELGARWQEVAPRMGLDPQTGLIPENARAFSRFAYNELAGSVDKDGKPMPEVYDPIPGANGQLLMRARTTGKVEQVTGQTLPDYSLEKSWDPNTGQQVVTAVMSKPGASPAPIAGIRALAQGSNGAPRAQPTLAPRGTTTAPNQNWTRRYLPNAPNATPAAAPPASTTSPPVAPGLGQPAAPPANVGYEKPSDTQLKVATLANYARSSIPIMKQMEDAGYRMSPTVRASVIQAATSEDPGYLSQWYSQEMLGHALSDQDKQYMAALMPFLQAAGHDMSGARLTTSAMRQAFESTIPVTSKDPKYLAEISNNRSQLYSGLLAGSGNAAQMPEFKSTLGADQTSIAKSGKAPVQVKTLQEARALPLGTTFITPDGRLKVR